MVLLTLSRMTLNQVCAPTMIIIVFHVWLMKAKNLKQLKLCNASEACRIDRLGPVTDCRSGPELRALRSASRTGSITSWEGKMKPSLVAQPTNSTKPPPQRKPAPKYATYVAIGPTANLRSPGSTRHATECQPRLRGGWSASNTCAPGSRDPDSPARHWRWSGTVSSSARIQDYGTRCDGPRLCRSPMPA
jgi:hypothetical protein